MGQATSCFRRRPKRKVLILGYTGSGRSTFYYKLISPEITNHIPLIGFLVQDYRFSGINSELWVVGGGWALCYLYNHYVDENLGGIFWIISNNYDLEESIKCFKKLRIDSKFPLRNVCFVINKFVQESNITKEAVYKAFELDEIHEFEFSVIEADITKDGEITDCVSWMGERLRNDGLREY